MTDHHEHADELPDEDFRLQLREWVQRHYPERLRDPLLRLRGEAARSWLQTQAEHGWRAPSWPRIHGGMGLSLRKQLIYQEEMERYGVARVFDMGSAMLGPILMRYGTETQKRRYLPRIIRYDDVWCQGYSEPNAGSDLANLRTEATRDGDWFVINGSKIWTSYATDASHMFMLARTGKLDKKQEGITFVVLPMTLPGITTRPIANLSGDEEFCEVFFDAVRVPLANVVGEIDHGWTVAKALLGFERITIGSPALARHAFGILTRVAHELALEGSPQFEEQYARLATDLYDVSSLYREVSERAIDGASQSYELSALKLLSSELLQRITEFIQESVGDYGGIVGETRIGRELVNVQRLFMIARPTTIFGGSSEVQRNILAKSMLGLPTR